MVHGIVVDTVPAFINAVSNTTVTTISIAPAVLILTDQQDSIIIDRDVVIEGIRGQTSLNTVDSVGLLFLQPNRTLTFQNMLIRYRTGFISDIDANFVKLSENATVQFINSTTRSLVCLPLKPTLARAPRASRVPGVQNYTVVTDYCADGTCWQNVNIVRDLAVDVKVRNRPGYAILRAINVIGECEYFVDSQCLNTTDATTCLIKKLTGLTTIDETAATTLPVWATVLIICGSIAALLCMATCGYFHVRKRRKGLQENKQVLPRVIPSMSSESPQSHNAVEQSLVGAVSAATNSLDRLVTGTTISSEGESTMSMPTGLQLGILLGTGAHGRVYKGMYYGNVAAIKLMERGGEVELKFMKILSHPNIVHVTETFERQHIRPAIVIMEYCDGGPLSDKLGTLPMATILSLLIDVIDGLRYLQWMHVVHADLKAENILLIKDISKDCGYTAKVSDFGLSRVLRVDETSYQTVSLGTISHLSPSVLQTGRYTHQSDVYAFGVVMLELVSTKRVWGDLHPLQIMDRVVSGIRPDFPDNVLPAYRQLAERCWTQNADERPNFNECHTELLSIYNSLSKPEFM